MRKLNLVLLGTLFSSFAFASNTENFVRGLKSDLIITKTGRGIDLGYKINIAPFGPLGQIITPDAVATYNGILNTINLSKENLESNGNYQIKDARKIRGKNLLSANVTTIFHEMGHAELDVFIENKYELDDTVLMYHYQNKLKPVYKKITSENPHTVFHEHFGYYRSDLMYFMYDELSNILINNGFNHIKNSCFLNASLRSKLKNGISLEEFTKFYPTSLSPLSPYRLKVNPKYVYVRGKDIDLSKANKKVIDETHLHFWSYHQTFYGFPMNEKDFINRLNKGGPFRKSLAKCRTELWHAHQDP